MNTFNKYLFIKCLLIISIAGSVGCATKSSYYRYDHTPPPEMNTSLPRMSGELDFAHRFAGLQFGSKIENVPNGFHEMDAAAIEVLQVLIPLSGENNREYGGYIYEKENLYYFTNPPVKGSGITVDIHQAQRLVPAGAKVVGDYHTHFSVRDRSEPTDACEDSMIDHDFSVGDIAGITDCSHKHSDYRGYLGTQAGSIQVFAPHAEVNFYTVWKGL